jgi:hypothetical protein
MTEPRAPRDLAERLRELREAPPEEDFRAALHRKLVAAGPPDEPSWWRRLRLRLAGEGGQSGAGRMLWPALGVAAGVAVFALLSRAPGQVQPQPLASAATQLPATKVAVVRVNLSTEVAVADAHIKVRLPEGLVFWADGQELAQREFEWTQPLDAGDNDIPIAVRGQRPGSYRMVVWANIGGASVEDEVLLEVVGG